MAIDYRLQCLARFWDEDPPPAPGRMRRHFSVCLELTGTSAYVEIFGVMVGRVGEPKAVEAMTLMENGLRDVIAEQAVLDVHAQLLAEGGLDPGPIVLCGIDFEVSLSDSAALCHVASDLAEVAAADPEGG